MLGKNNLLKFIIFFLISVYLNIPSYAVNDSALMSAELSEQENKPPVTAISYDNILKKANEHSYDLKIADYNILISKQSVRGAKSEYFPKLSIGAGMEYTKNYRDARDTTVMSIGDAFINPYTRFQSLLGITVSYNLFDFGVRGGNLKLAKEDVELKELETKQKMQDMSLTLLDIYAKILITTKQIEISKDILALEEKNLEMKERLFNAKEISKTELNDARVKVKNIKNRISELGALRQESVNWLSFYTGENYDSENIKPEILKKPPSDVTDFKDYTKSIIWKIHEKNIKKKELELYIVKRYNYPKLNAYGRYYWYGSDHNNWGKSFDIEPSNFSVGASFSMPVFDGFKNSANIEKTTLELKQLHMERDKAIAELMTKLATMRSNLLFLEEQINENCNIKEELSSKEKSVHKMVSKRLVSPIEENEVKIEILNQKIEYDKNNITHIAIEKGIQILTEEQ